MRAVRSALLQGLAFAGLVALVVVGVTLVTYALLLGAVY